MPWNLFGTFRCCFLVYDCVLYQTITSDANKAHHITKHVQHSLTI